MKKEIKNNSFVFYATSLEAVEKISEAYPEMGNELLKAIVEYGIYGEYDKTNPIIEAMMVNIGFGIDKAKDRYTKAVENGKQGGRPKMIDNEKVRELKEAGLTNREVAERLGCSVSSVEKANKENRETRKNRKNPNDNVVNDNDNEKEKENGNGNGNGNEKIHPNLFTEGTEMKLKRNTEDESLSYLDDEVLADGYVEKEEKWLDEIIPHFGSYSNTVQTELLKEKLGYSDKEAKYILENILDKAG